MKGRSPATTRPVVAVAVTLALWAITALTLSPRYAIAQSVAQRTPNLTNLWTPVRGIVQFNFTHRFDISDPPLHKITNTPSFQVATAIAGPLSAGFVYGSNSDLVPAYPNEWEWFTRLSLLSRDNGGPLDASVQAGWNLAAESFDTELAVAREVGPLRLLAAGRAFHHAFYQQGARYALAGGAALRLSPWLTVAGDYAALTDRVEGERPAWGLGLQLTVPATPHSMSLHAGNVGTGSMEGASRGKKTRWGFEYTVPITLARYSSSRSTRRSPSRSTTPAPDPELSTRKGDTVVVTIRNFKFLRDKITINAGDVVVWRNADPVDHLLWSETAGFESPLIAPGRDWSQRFASAGSYTYFCRPHPFMKAEIRVREAKP